jgi:hypothetical protein
MNILDSFFPECISREISEYYYPKFQTTQKEMDEIFYRLFRVCSIFTDTKIVASVYKIPICMGLLKLVDSRDHPEWIIDKFYQLGHTEFQNIILNSPNESGTFKQPEGHALFHLQESDMIANSYIKAGDIETSPMKFILSPWCEKCKLHGLKFEDVWDGKNILNICLKCRT